TVSSDTPTQGFPLEFANGAFIEIDVTKSDSASGRKQITVTQSSRGQTFVKFLHTDGADNGWKEIPYVNASDPFETVNSSKAKANEAENNAKVYTDGKISEQHKVLLNGSTSKVGSAINLTSSISDYNMVVISRSFPGGTFNEAVLVLTIVSYIVIQKLNLRDTDGMLLGVYEIKLYLVNNTRLTISNDVSWSEATNEGSGPGRNAFTINKIEGFK